MKRYFLIITASAISYISLGQSIDSRLKDLGGNPLFFLDSTEKTFQEVQKVDPQSISNIVVLLPRTAKKKMGKRAEDGAVFIITTGFVQNAYTSYLAKKYKEYRRLIEKYTSDSLIAYIINNTFYNNTFPAEIYNAISSGIRKFQIISKEQYESKYNVLIKESFVAIITTKKKKT